MVVVDEVVVLPEQGGVVAFDIQSVVVGEGLLPVDGPSFWATRISLQF